MVDEHYPKEIIYNNEMLDRLEEGVKAVHDAVGRTMGPRGQLVMYEANAESPYPTVTKDGVSVASMIAFRDEAKNNGSQFVIQAARKQVYETGDGTTLTSILTYKIFTEGRKLFAAGYSPSDLMSGIKEAVKDVVEYIKSISKTDLDLDALKDIARISTNNDVELADIIAEAVYKTGKHGLVTNQRSPHDRHEIEYQDGYQLDIGIMDRIFCNVNELYLKFENPYILITDQNIVQFSTLHPILEQIQAKHKEECVDGPIQFVLISPQVSAEVLAVMKRNITDQEFQQFHMVHIRPSKDLKPAKNRMIFEDLAAITGGMFISESSGYQIDNLNLSQLGTCDSLISYPEKTMINGFNAKTDERILNLKARLENAKTDHEKDLIEESIAKLDGGIAIIKVGGQNLSEQAETIFRVDDAVSACKSAQDMGYVRGGGVAMIEAQRKLDSKAKQNIGYRMLLEILSYPAEIILNNANNKGHAGIINELQLGNNGYYINDTKIMGELDMYEMGIIDPTKVIVHALKNAASSAISMLNTTVMIILYREENE